MTNDSISAGKAFIHFYLFFFLILLSDELKLTIYKTEKVIYNG